LNKNMITLMKDFISLGFYACSRVFQGANPDNEAVLVYHSISDMKPRDDLYKINIQTQLFARHLEFISKAKITNLILTFDDGFENFFSNAFRAILRYNIKTVLFISTDFIEGKFSFDHLFGNNCGLKPLSWQQVKEIADSGIEIGSHAISHRNLTSMDIKGAHREISESKKIIEDKIGRAVKYFAYPYGSRAAFDDRLKQMAMAAGYKKAYVNIMGFNRRDSDQYALRRIRIYADDIMPRFKMKIAGAYNWIDRINNFRKQKSNA